MKTFVIFVLAVFCTLRLGVTADKFKLMTEHFPPLNYSISGKTFEHSEENIKGICTDIIRKIFADAGFEFKLRLRQWDYAYNYAQKKANRGVFCTTLTEERKPLFKWVGPLAQDDWVIYAVSSFKESIKKEEDLRKYKIGAYKDDVRAIYLEEKGMQVSVLTDDRLNPERLKEGLIDLWISSSALGPALAKQAGVKDLRPVFTLKETKMYLALNIATKPRLVEKLMDSYKKLKDAGVVDSITREYLKTGN